MNDLTIICVTCNDEQYLPKLLESINRQSFGGSCRFLFTDVGSEDRSVQLIDAFVGSEKRAERLTVDAENEADAYNTLLDQVDSTYVLFLQASAEPAPEFLKELLVQADLHLADILVYRSMGANDRTTDFSDRPYTDRVINEDEKILYFRSIYGCHCGPDGRLYRTEFLRSDPRLRFEADDAFYIGNHGWISTILARRAVVSSNITCPVARRSRAERRKQLGYGYGVDAALAERRMTDFFTSDPHWKEKYLPVFTQKGMPGLNYHKRTYSEWNERREEQERINTATIPFRSPFDPRHAELPLDIETSFFNIYDPSAESTKRLYLPINWNYFDNCSDPDGRLETLTKLQTFLVTLNEEYTYFTVATGRPAKSIRLPRDTIVFSGCGNPMVPDPELNHKAIPTIRTDCRYVDHGRLRPIVASFYGEISTHPCRKKMVEKLTGNNAFEFGCGLPHEKFMEKMQLTEFALCPRGFGPTSFRFYESMCAGAIPVYISDDFYLPYRDKIDWKTMCIQVTFDQIERIPDILAGISDSKRRELRSAGRSFVESYLNLNRTVKEISRMLQEEYYAGRVLVKPHVATPPQYNLVCYSLFGNDPKYTKHVVENLDIIAEVFPDWTCRFYVDDTVPADIMQTLRSRNCEIVPSGRSVGEPCSDPFFARPGGLSGMMWRFAPFWEPEVDRFIIQDADDTPSYTFLQGLRRWMASGKLLYTFHAYPWYSRRASASMLAARGGALCGRLDPTQMTELANVSSFQYGDDENWFNRSIISALRHSWYSVTTHRCPDLPGKEKLSVAAIPPLSRLRLKYRPEKLPDEALLKAELMGGAAGSVTPNPGNSVSSTGICQ